MREFPEGKVEYHLEHQERSHQAIPWGEICKAKPGHSYTCLSPWLPVNLGSDKLAFPGSGQVESNKLASVVGRREKNSGSGSGSSVGPPACAYHITPPLRACAAPFHCYFAKLPLPLCLPPYVPFFTHTSSFSFHLLYLLHFITKGAFGAGRSREEEKKKQKERSKRRKKGKRKKKKREAKERKGRRKKKEERNERTKKARRRRREREREREGRGGVRLCLKHGFRYRFTTFCVSLSFVYGFYLKMSLRMLRSVVC